MVYLWSPKILQFVWEKYCGPKTYLNVIESIILLNKSDLNWSEAWIYGPREKEIEFVVRASWKSWEPTSKRLVHLRNRGLSFSFQNFNRNSKKKYWVQFSLVNFYLQLVQYIVSWKVSILLLWCQFFTCWIKKLFAKKLSSRNVSSFSYFKIYLLSFWILISSS